LQWLSKKIRLGLYRSFGGAHPYLVQQDDPADGDTRSDARITASGSWPFVERRRPGRAGYTSRHLIAVLRGQAAKEDDSAEPVERDAAVNSGSTWPLIFLVALAVVLWVVVGQLVRLVIRLM
jgi:hypothetical protein